MKNTSNRAGMGTHRSMGRAAEALQVTPDTAAQISACETDLRNVQPVMAGVHSSRLLARRFSRARAVTMRRALCSSLLATAMATCLTYGPARAEENAESNTTNSNASTIASVTAPSITSLVRNTTGSPVHRMEARLKRSGQTQQLDDTSQYYSVYRYATVNARQASAGSIGLVRNVGGQTATATTQTKDAKAQTPAPAAPAGPTTRALPSPIENPPFPFTDWTINSGFPIGENWDSSPGTLQHALFGTKYDKTPWRVGGWMDAGIVMSNAKNSNLPDTYNEVPNRPQLDQFVFVVQKMVDTVQKDHTDWGFYSSQLYGIDYRFTSAKGYFDNQLLGKNNLYGYDPVLNWGEIYLPKVADGTVIQFGRYISPIDIEAQLSNSNYLYSHSLMFGVDPYTYTGINAQVRVNKCFEYQIGLTAGNENSPWSGGANANGEFLIGWNSADNKDSLWGGLDSWTPSGKAIRGHDDEQIINWVWGHVWSKNFHMQTQAYYMWEWDALVGGTPITGPVEPYASSGVGAKIPGKAYAIGFVNNLEYKLNKNDYLSFRSGFLSDPQGWRTGVATDYSDFTFGYSHLFARNFWIRPEVRYDHSYGLPSFDNGTLKSLYSISADIITRF